MTTTSAPAPSLPTLRRPIPKWDKGIAILCLVLAFMTAIFLTGLTGMFVMAGDSCAPTSPCMDEVGRGINISLLGMVGTLVIGSVCMLIAAITRTRLAIWAVATLLLVPVPSFIGGNIANHAMQLSHTAPSHS
ncbi:hypothetical protein AB0N05_32630 [Nocardia sp. NPDC051030]|uniref:hypothetical protein n=1 Tax=Nocardia sp. NPDC051030 TaxID=3155162 RepID=UPI003439A2BB